MKKEKLYIRPKLQIADKIYREFYSCIFIKLSFMEEIARLFTDNIGYIVTAGTPSISLNRITNIPLTVTLPNNRSISLDYDINKGVVFSGMNGQIFPSEIIKVANGIFITFELDSQKIQTILRNHR